MFDKRHLENTCISLSVKSYWLGLITRVKKYDHITPVLKKLHWLEIDGRIIDVSGFTKACMAVTLFELFLIFKFQI